MATNVLYQVSWFVPCTHEMNSSRSNQLASSKFALSFGYKAQPLKSYSLSGYGFQKTVYPHVARRNLIAFAESADAAPAEDGAESMPVEEESTEDTESSLVVQDVAEQPQVALARTRRPKLNQLMGYLNKQAVDAVEEKRPIPDIRVGDVVQLRVTVPRTRRRFALYKGVVISRQNAGIQTTIRVRRIIAGVGVEIVFPIYSPLITEVTILEHKKVRRARLYYLRDKLPKFSTVK